MFAFEALTVKDLLLILEYLLDLEVLESLLDPEHLLDQWHPVCDRSVLVQEWRSTTNVYRWSCIEVSNCYIQGNKSVLDTNHLAHLAQHFR